MNASNHKDFKRRTISSERNSKHMNRYLLKLIGWIKLNQYRWDLKPQLLKPKILNNSSPSKTFMYLGKNVRIIVPQLNHYLSVILLFNNRLKHSGITMSRIKQL